MKIHKEFGDKLSKDVPKHRRSARKDSFVLPRIVNIKADNDKYRRIRDKQQKICKHKFEPPNDPFYSAENRFLHCRKCHKTKRKF
jgi:hypothetical protein